jgi:hypothetical protein
VDKWHGLLLVKTTDIPNLEITNIHAALNHTNNLIINY